jgi:hypothetical protein
METTERIVEAYVRYIKRWATIPNIKCKGQGEIDLFAIDPITNRRYHIETGVSISGGFSALTALPFKLGEYKIRGKQAKARASPLPSLRSMCARQRDLFRRRARTAASPT